MKNKIIILLMFVLVVVLASYTWQSISQDAGQNFQQDSKQQPQKIIEKSNKNKTTQLVSETGVDLNNEQLMTIVEKSNQVDDKQEDDQPKEKLCELVSKYDDWQNSGSGFTSQKLVDEIRGWGNTRGYFEMEYNGSGMEIKKTSDYDYYETEDLQQMADAGDPIANVKFAYRLFLKADPASLEEAQPYCEKAVVHGYSAMLRCKTSYLNHLVTQHENQEEPDAERIEELHVEIQAWQKLYQLRNDPLGELFEVQFFTEVEGVEVDDEKVDAKAQTLYDDIVKRRNNLGLGDFDSEPAPDIINYAVEHDIQEGAVAKCFE